MLQELIMASDRAMKIYYDGRKDDPNCYRWNIYIGVLAADCKVGDKVIIQHGDDLYSTVTTHNGKEYPLRIEAIEQFNKSFQEGTAGLEVCLVFRKSKLPEDKVKIYKAP